MHFNIVGMTHCSRIAKVAGLNPTQVICLWFFFSHSLGKYWVYSASTHRCIWANQIYYALSPMLIAIINLFLVLTKLYFIMRKSLRQCRGWLTWHVINVHYYNIINRVDGLSFRSKPNLLQRHVHYYINVLLLYFYQDNGCSFRKVAKHNIMLTRIMYNLRLASCSLLLSRQLLSNIFCL